MSRFSKLLIFTLILVLGSTAPVLSQSPRTYQNPVFEPVLADPSIIRTDDGWFYVYGTEDDWGDGKGSKLMPILRSQNLVDWEYVGDVFQTKPDWKEQGYLWAPDITYYNDQYYLFYSYSVWGDYDPGIGVATAIHPSGPFADQGPLFFSSEIGVSNSIDPYFLLDNGVPYLFWGSFHGIFGVELASDGLSTVGEPFQIAGRAFEATYIIKRDGYYYFFGSVGSCCEGDNSGYHVIVGRSDNLTGPYVDEFGADLIFSSRTTGKLLLVGHFPGTEGPVFVGPGHNSVITDDAGTDWLIYHAVDKSAPWLLNGATRRPLMIDPIHWVDGWPTIEGLVPSVDQRPAPVIF